MFRERFLDGQLADGHPAGEAFADGPVLVGSFARALLDRLEFAGRRFDLAGFDLLALDAGDVDRGEHVAHPAGAGAQIGRRSGLVDEFDGNVRQVVDDACADHPRAVADANQGVRRVVEFRCDHVGSLGGRNVERGDDGVPVEDGDSRSIAGVDADGGPAPVATEDGEGFLDGAARGLGVGTDDIDAGVDVAVGTGHEDGGVVRDVVVGLDGGEGHAAVAELVDHAVVHLEVLRGDDDHTRAWQPGDLACGTTPLTPQSGLSNMHEQFRRPPLQSPERPDTFFAFVAGLYAAALLSPAAVIALGLWVTGDAGVLYIGLLLAVTVIVGLTSWGVSRWRGLPERLGATRLAWGLALLPASVMLGHFVFVAHVNSAGADAGAVAGFLLGLPGMVVGIGLVRMARNRYTAALVDEDAVACEWKAGWPEPQRQRMQYVSIAGMLVLVGAMAVDALWNVEWLFTVAQFLFAPAIVVGNLGQQRTYRVTPAGLERRYPASRYVYGWDAFESYAVTDETIVVRWRAWWRPTIWCARADVDDVDAVLDALAAHLERA